MKIRKATIHDKERVLEICKQIWEGDDYIPNIFDHWVADEAGEFTLIEEDGKISGMGKLTLLEPEIGWLEGLRVAPEARSKGYAREITKYYLQKGEEQGFNQLCLSTYHRNYASIHVIESYGFKRVADFYFTEQEVEPLKGISAVGEIIQATPESGDVVILVEKMLQAPEQKGAKNYLGFGWNFRKLSRELILKEIELGHIYYTKRDGEIEGGILIHPDLIKDKGVYYITMVTGTDEAVSQLLKWAHQNATEWGMELLAAMVPNDPRLKSLYLSHGFNCWEEDQSFDTTVFIYEYDFKREV